MSKRPAQAAAANAAAAAAAGAGGARAYPVRADLQYHVDIVIVFEPLEELQHVRVTFPTLGQGPVDGDLGVQLLHQTT